MVEYPVEKQFQAAVGSARGVHNSLKIFYLPGLKQYSIDFLVWFDFLYFSKFPQTRVQNWLKIT